MAELNQVNFGEKAPQEKSLTLEEEAALIDAKAAENNTVETQQPEGEEQQVEEQQVERPEWLDEKFQSPEDLQKAYHELQKKQGEQKTKEVDTSNSVDVINNASDVFAEKGELSEEIYEQLENIGLSKDVVNSYIAGTEAIITQEAQEIQGTIGGKDKYEEMIEWAQTNLSAEEQEAYDSVVESGTKEQAIMAVQGMYARFQSNSGVSPNLQQGSTSGPGDTPFTSAAQVTAAMRDPRYKTDPAYRGEVERRLAVSNVI